MAKIWGCNLNECGYLNVTPVLLSLWNQVVMDGIMGGGGGGRLKRTFFFKESCFLGLFQDSDFFLGSLS